VATTATRHAGDICPDCEIIRLPGALCPLHAAAPEMAEAIAWLLPLASAYLRSAPSHPDHAKLETARALLARLEETR